MEKKKSENTFHMDFVQVSHVDLQRKNLCYSSLDKMLSQEVLEWELLDWCE